MILWLPVDSTYGPRQPHIWLCLIFLVFCALYFCLLITVITVNSVELCLCVSVTYTKLSKLCIVLLLHTVLLASVFLFILCIVLLALF